MSADIPFTKDKLDYYLRELGKEFRRLNGKKMPAELILVGGASVLANYGFRDNTYDVDALIQASSSMNDAINTVGDAHGLPNGWLNSDFKKTKSYSPKLPQYSKYYKTFSNVLTVRTISSEYLVAMKLMSLRQYKHDVSDIVGILWEQKEQGRPLSFTDIDKAVINLYDSWDNLPGDAQSLVVRLLDNKNLEKLYLKFRNEEKAAKAALIDFEKKYPNVVSEDNLSSILSNLKAKKNENLKL